MLFPDRHDRISKPSANSFLIGILPGEGIGPEIIATCLDLLHVIERFRPLVFALRWGGKIGKDSISESGKALSSEVSHFCQQIFDEGGAVFCGPGGGRFVYDLRLAFDLYCKLAPIQPLPALLNTGPIMAAARGDVDLLVVRENTGGVYQGEYGFQRNDDQRHAFHLFGYTDPQVVRIVRTAANLAGKRRGRLCVVTKPGGVPAISQQWEEIAEQECRNAGIELRSLEVDNACYQIIANARDFDVIVTPNLFGDILADNAALLLGSRGVSYSANYSPSGYAVYQTGHGAAHDLAGTDRANPVGQILSLAMMLESTFGLDAIAADIRRAANDALDEGWRTADMAAPGATIVGTKALGEKIAAHLEKRLATGDTDHKALCK